MFTLNAFRFHIQIGWVSQIASTMRVEMDQQAPTSKNKSTIGSIVVSSSFFAPIKWFKRLFERAVHRGASPTERITIRRGIAKKKNNEKACAMETPNRIFQRTQIQHFSANFPKIYRIYTVMLYGFELSWLLAYNKITSHLE